jgi:hypothetical protein
VSFTLQVEDFTMGYVMDRRLGNTGGLGGAFGLLYAIGCPFPYPEGRPWQSSLQQTVRVKQQQQQQRLFTSQGACMRTSCWWDGFMWPVKEQVAVCL